MQLDQRGKAHAQTVGVSFWERAAEKFVKQKCRFEIRAGWGVLDCADGVPKVQPSRVFFRGAQQSRQSPAQVGGLADVRFTLRIRTAEAKDRRLSRHGGENLCVMFRREL